MNASPLLSYGNSWAYLMRLKKFRNGFLFGVSALVYLSYNLAIQGDWLLSPGMWAENATIYWDTARDGFQVSDLLVRDAGYLPIFTHLISAAIQLFQPPPSAIPTIYAWAGLVVAFIPVALLHHRTFRTIVPNDFERFLMVLFVLFFMNTWGTANFLNSSYSMFFLVCSLALLHLRRDDSTEIRVTIPTPFFLLALGALGMLSKPALLVLMPLLALGLRSRFRRIRAFSMLTLILGLVQLVTIAHSRFHLGILTQETELDLVTLLKIGTEYFIAFPFRFLVGPFITDFLLAGFSSILTSASLIFGLVFWIYVFRLIQDSSRAEQKLELVGLSFTMGATVFFNVVTIPDLWNSQVYKIYSVPLHTRSISLFILMILLIATIMRIARRPPIELEPPSRQAVKASSSRKTLAVSLWLALSGWAIYIVILSVTPNWPITGNSNWRQVESSKAETERCAILDPWAWGAWSPRGCSVLAWSDYSEYTILLNGTKVGNIPTLGYDGEVAELDAIAIALYSDEDSVSSFIIEMYEDSASSPVTFSGELRLREGSRTYIIYLERGSVPVRVAAVKFTLEEGSAGSLIMSDGNGDEILSFVVLSERPLNEFADE